MVCVLLNPLCLLCHPNPSLTLQNHLTSHRKQQATLDTGLSATRGGWNVSVVPSGDKGLRVVVAGGSPTKAQAVVTLKVCFVCRGAGIEGQGHCKMQLGRLACALGGRGKARRREQDQSQEDRLTDASTRNRRAGGQPGGAAQQQAARLGGGQDQQRRRGGSGVDAWVPTTAGR